MNVIYSSCRCHTLQPELHPIKNWVDFALNIKLKLNSPICKVCTAQNGNKQQQQQQQPRDTFGSYPALYDMNNAIFNDFIAWLLI